MGCKICGRNSCTPSFHSVEEQETFEETDKTGEIVDSIVNKVNRLYTGEVENEEYVKLSEVMDILNSMY